MKADLRELTALSLLAAFCCGLAWFCAATGIDHAAVGITARAVPAWPGHFDIEIDCVAAV
jgi:hypothetical protein